MLIFSIGAMSVQAAPGAPPSRVDKDKDKDTPPNGIGAPNKVGCSEQRAALAQAARRAGRAQARPAASRAARRVAPRPAHRPPKPALRKACAPLSSTSRATRSLRRQPKPRAAPGPR